MLLEYNKETNFMSSKLASTKVLARLLLLLIESDKKVALVH